MVNEHSARFLSDLVEVLALAKAARIPQTDPNVIRCELLAKLLEEGLLHIGPAGTASATFHAWSALHHEVSQRSPAGLRAGVTDAVDHYLKKPRDPDFLPAYDLWEP